MALLLPAASAASPSLNASPSLATLAAAHGAFLRHAAAPTIANAAHTRGRPWIALRRAHDQKLLEGGRGKVLRPVWVIQSAARLLHLVPEPVLRTLAADTDDTDSTSATASCRTALKPLLAPVLAPLLTAYVGLPAPHDSAPASSAASVDAASAELYLRSVATHVAARFSDLADVLSALTTTSLPRRAPSQRTEPATPFASQAPLALAATILCRALREASKQAAGAPGISLAADTAAALLRPHSSAALICPTGGVSSQAVSAASVMHAAARLYGALLGLVPATAEVFLHSTTTDSVVADAQNARRRTAELPIPSPLSTHADPTILPLPLPAGTPWCCDLDAIAALTTAAATAPALGAGRISSTAMPQPWQQPASLGATSQARLLLDATAARLRSFLGLPALSMQATSNTPLTTTAANAPATEGGRTEELVATPPPSLRVSKPSSSPLLARTHGAETASLSTSASEPSRLNTRHRMGKHRGRAATGDESQRSRPVRCEEEAANDLLPSILPSPAPPVDRNATDGLAAAVAAERAATGAFVRDLLHALDHPPPAVAMAGAEVNALSGSEEEVLVVHAKSKVPRRRRRRVAGTQVDGEGTLRHSRKRRSITTLPVDAQVMPPAPSDDKSNDLVSEQRIVAMLEAALRC